MKFIKNIFLILCFMFGVSSVCMASRIVLQDGQGREVGTESNPLYVSGEGGGGGSSQWSDGASDAIYYNDGNVGIGTSDPSTELEVVGTITASSVVTSGVAESVSGSNAEINFTTNGAGTITFSATNGTNNENLFLDCETTENVCEIDSTSDAEINYNLNSVIKNEKKLFFGDLKKSSLQWVTNDAGETETAISNLVLGLGLNNDSYGGYFAIMEDADIGSPNRYISKSSRPMFRIYGPDAVNYSLNYGQFYSNDADFWIGTGHGKIWLTPGKQRSDKTQITTGVELNAPSGLSLKLGFNANGSNRANITLEPTFAQMTLGVMTTGSGNQFLIVNKAHDDLDFDINSRTNPTFGIFSATSPDVSNNEYVLQHHNQTNFIIETGAETGTGTTPTTIENSILLSPRGTETFRASSVGAKITGTTTLVGATNNCILTVDADATCDAGTKIGEDNSIAICAVCAAN